MTPCPQCGGPVTPSERPGQVKIYCGKRCADRASSIRRASAIDAASRSALWTEEQTQRLIELANYGEHSQIGLSVIFGKTKDQIAGKLRRLRESGVEINLAHPAPANFTEQRRFLPVLPDAENGCAWVHGDTKAEWRYCRQPTVRNGKGDQSAWCEKHFWKVYVRR